MTREQATQNIDEIDFLTWQIDIIEDMLDKIFNDHEAELEEVQKTIKNLKHNYDVQVTFNNIAYKNYTNMVNSLEQRIKELEALQSRSCDGCKHLLASPRICLKRIQNCDGILPKDFCCNRYKPKEQ